MKSFNYLKGQPRLFRYNQALAILLVYGFQSVGTPLLQAAVPEVQAGSVAGEAQLEAYVLYSRVAGETLEEVAARFDMSVEALRFLQTRFVSYGWNSKVLLVPYDTATESRLYPAYVLYQMRKGENLSSLAFSVNRSERELRNVNAMLVPHGVLSTLRAGDWIVLPAPVKVATPSALEKEQNPGKGEQVAQAVVSAVQTYDSLRETTSSAEILENDLTQRALGAATGALSQGIADALNKHGNAQVSVQASSASSDVNLALDYLHPLFEGSDDILFAQVGVRTFDERVQGNLGLGYRHQVHQNLMLGANAFIDQDFSRNHTRGGVGVEAWTNEMRLAANYYAPLSGWKKSDQDHLNEDPTRMDLYERAAKGWDVRAEGAIPGAPSLAVTAKYFQWKGEGVDAFGSGQLEKDPKGYGVGMKWQPMPLMGFSAERQEINGGEGEWVFGANFTWNFDMDLDSQLRSGSTQALKPLAQARRDFVEREYNIVLDYKHEAKYENFRFQQSLIEIAANPALGGPVTVASPAVSGVPAGGVVVYEIVSVSPPSAAGQVTIDPRTGVLTVAPGAQAQTIQVAASLFMPAVAKGTDTMFDQVLATLGSAAEGVINALVPQAHAVQHAVVELDHLPQGFVQVAEAQYQAVISEAVERSTVIIDGLVAGSPQVGSALTVEVNCGGACSPNLAYQWQIETAVGSGEYENIVGANSDSYMPIGAEQRRRIQVEVLIP